MEKLKFIPLLMLFALLFGCDDNQIEISASATATKNIEGETITMEASQNELDSLDDFRRNIERINTKYPRPELPMKQPTFQVLNVSNSGVFKLKGGKKVKMSGIKCNEQGVEFIKRFYSESSEKLAFSPPENSTADSIVSAYIWQVDTSLMDDPETKDIFTGPSYSGMNDTVILNNWCEIDFENQSKFHNRYIALEKISYRNNK